MQADAAVNFQKLIYGDVPASPDEQLRRNREVAVEMALRERLERQFGSYEIDGGAGVIRSTVGVAINYRELAQIAVAHADLTEGRPLRGQAAANAEA